MRLLRNATLEQDGFMLEHFDAFSSESFQSSHAAIYGALLPGENAANTLARGVRWGVFAHHQLTWLDRNTYSLPEKLNPDEKGRVRRFVLIPEPYLRRPEIELFLRQAFLIWNFPESPAERAYEVQLSAIRYQPTIATTALPSPLIPHQDLIDGAVLVLAKTENLLGGTSRLYTLDDEPLYEMDLSVGDALFIRDARLKHQVTPLQLSPGAQWRPGQSAYRDILIARFQPVGR